MRSRPRMDDERRGNSRRLSRPVEYPPAPYGVSTLSGRGESAGCVASLRCSLSTPVLLLLISVFPLQSNSRYGYQLNKLARRPSHDEGWLISCKVSANSRSLLVC